MSKDKSIEDQIEIAREQVHAHYRLKIAQYEQRFKNSSGMANSLMTDLEKANQIIWSLKQEIEKHKSESNHAPKL